MFSKIIKWFKSWFKTKDNTTTILLRTQTRFCENPQCCNKIIGKSNKRFCSESCKKKSKYQRQKKSKNQNPDF